MHKRPDTTEPGYWFINQAIYVSVSVSHPDVWPCNGFAWYADSVGFVLLPPEVPGCVASGRNMGIFVHEYGHCLTASHYQPWGCCYQGLDEGNAYILNNLVLMDPVMARGFNYPNNCTSGYYEAINSRRYPSDVVGAEAHAAGLVIAGFHWDATRELMRRYGTAEAQRISGMAWHSALKRAPGSQPDQVYYTFDALDDDADSTNGSPYYEAFRIAALNHGFKPRETEFEGACCNSLDGTCTIVEWSQCPSGSVWQGTDTVCQPDPCAPLEAEWRALGDGMEGGQVRALAVHDEMLVPDQARFLAPM
jgi:hypothetical protein